MKKEVRYYYPAVFHYGQGQEIRITFPDLEITVSAADDVKALIAAREALGNALFEMENRKQELPAPTPLSEVPNNETERAVLIDVFMPRIRMANTTQSVSRTVTVPAWLNAAALEENINFSKVLQEGLKRELGLD